MASLSIAEYADDPSVKYRRGQWRATSRAAAAAESTAVFRHEFSLAPAQRGVPASRLKRIVGFGHPLLDISVVGDEELAADYDIKPGAVALAKADQLPIYQRIARMPGAKFIPGGSCMNTMRVARWMLGSSADESTVSFVGAVGDDDFGRTLSSALASSGIHAALNTAPDGMPTGTCAVIVLQKARTMLTHLGAARACGSDELAAPLARRCLEAADFVYVEGFAFNTTSPPPPASNAPTAAAIACAPPRCFALNLSAPFLLDVYRAEFAALLPDVELCFGNADDFAAWAAGAGLAATASPQEIVRACASVPSAPGRRRRSVFMTRGVQPVVAALWERADAGAGGGVDQALFSATPLGGDAATLVVREFPVPRVPDDRVVDDTGAGDSFVGGFFAAAAHDRPLPMCVQAGLYAASIAVQYTGVQLPDLPAWDFARGRVEV